MPCDGCLSHSLSLSCYKRAEFDTRGTFIRNPSRLESQCERGHARRIRPSRQDDCDGWSLRNVKVQKRLPSQYRVLLACRAWSAKRTALVRVDLDLAMRLRTGKGNFVRLAIGIDYEL